MDLDTCHSNATCFNNNGSFICECNTGFNGTGIFCEGTYVSLLNNNICILHHLYSPPFTDVDECIDDLHNCHDNATCNNTFGSFHCICNSGYTGDGFNCTSK